jgi:hypothetical protein
VGLDCTLPTDPICIFQMAIGFPEILFFGKNQLVLKER